MKLEIKQALLSLRQQQKTPSLALLKAKLARPYPMPELINALSQWKSQGDKILEIESPAIDAPLTPDNDINALKDEIEQLKQRIQTLERLFSSSSTKASK